MRITKMISTASAIIYKRQTKRFPVSPQYLYCYNPVLPFKGQHLHFHFAGYLKAQRQEEVIGDSYQLPTSYSFLSLVLPRVTVPTVH